MNKKVPRFKTDQEAEQFLDRDLTAEPEKLYPRHV